jgi:hypothetical protein
MATGVIVGGKTYPLLHPLTGHPIPVFNWHDTGMEFKVGDGHNKRRTVDITLGVYHWTGSENPVETMYRVLHNRDLGIEACITALGSLYQFCDPLLVDTADAGRANKISFGVEIINQGVTSLLNPKKWKTPRAQMRGGYDLGPRTSYETVIHGRRKRCYDFYPQQTATMCALNALMVEAIPTYEPNVCIDPGVIDWENFRGAAGHLQIETRKIDPGTRPMKTLQHFMRTGRLPNYVMTSLLPATA